MARPKSKATSADETRDQLNETTIIDEDNLTKDQDQSSNNEEEERRLKLLEDELVQKQKELEACRLKTREKTLRQRIEEEDETLKRLNKEIENEKAEVEIIEEPTSATKSNQDKNTKSFMAIDTESLL